MDEREHEEILYRLDERTKRVDDHLNRLDQRVEQVEANIENHESRISENEDDIETAEAAARGIGATLLALISGLAAKFGGLLHI